MGKMSVPVIVVVIILLVGGYFVFTTESTNGGVAPSFSLENYEGNIVSSSDFEGKIQVINVWASWCPFCVKELEDFAQLQEEFQDIVVIGINRGEKIDTAKGYTDELGITGRMILLLDEKSSYYGSIGGFSMPETLFVKGDGTIFLHKRGPLTFDEMKEIINNY